ncbi:hypothetical protein DNU06_10990 [Putridiphycobacter roseus]|uniref:Uncharacterized protein n=1 Tax=Putridiphycobacter roseus TaxID=2219161 RepID=A0A2W1NQ73_9FLAO|nr:gliding motility-associated C-terminal domain-containing protein [Putridiphycobacter roseus]PZE16778.1 hypothetical protein DNU06_10990 [Putridiphycobacter roseus]
MIKSIKNLMLSLFLVAFSTPLFASHVQGGNISYKCTGNPNEFIITLIVYRDCSGVAVQPTYALDVFNDCGLTVPNIIVNLVGELQVSQLCPGAVGNSPCYGGTGTEEGTIMYEFNAVVTLPGLCDAWTFGWGACNRNTVENLVGNPCFYVETKLFSATQACNNSVTINNPQPTPYVCVNQGVNYDYGVQEQDGDSLFFELVAALADNGDTISYNSPYTPTSPVPNIFINSETGAINFNSPIAGNFVIAIKVTEYNKCGELVGQTIHDMQFVIDDQCVNNAPYQIADPSAPVGTTAGIYNFNNFGTGATLLPGNKIDMCVSDRFCFDIAFTDNDLDNIDITSNINDFLPGATITQASSSPNAVATICWEFQQGYTGNLISINANDGQCPIPGIVSRVVELKIPPALFPGLDDTITFCGDEGVINFNDYLGPVFDNNGVWHNGNSQIITGLADVDTITPGVYFHIVYPDTSVNSCVDPPACVVADSAYLTINVSNLQVADHVYVDESCQNQFDGSSTVGPITGNAGPFTVLWSAPNTQALGNHDTIVNNGGIATYGNLFDDTPGLWNVLVTDQIGCTWTENFEINQGFLQFTQEEINNPQCFGFSNGSINLSATTTGGQTVTFVFTDAQGNVVPGSTGNAANNLSAGVYTVTATTANGCLVEKNYQLFDPAKITANFTYTMPLCNGLSTGKLKATNIFNQKGDIDDVFFAWAPAPAGHNGFGVDSLMNLPAGAYSLVFTEDGCSNDTTIYITEPDPLQVLIDTALIKKTYCRTAAYQNGNGVVSASTAGPGYNGTGTPTYLWENLANGDESTFTTFVVKVPGYCAFTATDENGCISSDTVFVDSLNPIADFTIVSDEFYDATIYEGTEDVKIKITNTSQNFAQVGNPLSDTIFQWNLFSNNPDGNQWFFTYRLEDKVDTTYKGINLNEPTDYEICLVAKNFNDCVDTTCRIVKVHKEFVFEMPNVFTPGAYPNNEFFFPAAGVSVFSATLLNRYGIPVYEFDNITDTWDGTNYKNDKPCADGVYFYTYTGETTNGTPIEGNGNVTLINAKK